MYNKHHDNRGGSLNRPALEYLRMGCSSLLRTPIKTALSVIYWGSVILLICTYDSLFDLTKWEIKLLQPIMYFMFPVAAMAGFLLAIMLFAIPRRAWKITNALRRAGITNKLNEVPIPCSVSDNEIVVLADGVSPDTFNDKLTDLESALNMRIVRISDGVDKRHVIISTAPGDAKLPDKVELDLDNLPEKESVLALGRALDGEVTVDLNLTPHLLVGGSSGSGKSSCIVCLVAQALAKGMTVYIFDPKGGVDYPMSWKGALCDFSDDPASILSELSYLVRELYRRMGKFKDIERIYHTACPNLQTFNRLCTTETLSRILVVVDEISTITDTVGADRAHKERAATIISHLSDIARLGRAFGIHLLIATQRPDANSVPGQVKNNCDVRLAARSDLVLSQIILDNGDAASIPKDKPGRFITNIDGGTEFQGYYVDANSIG